MLAAAARATTAAWDIEGEGRTADGQAAWGQRASPPPAITGVRSAQMATDFILVLFCSSPLARGLKIACARTISSEGSHHEDLLGPRRPHLALRRPAREARAQ